MSILERADAYLTIPEAYGLALGGVRWSHKCDAVEWQHGAALALAEELRPLLEGVFTKPPPPFPFVLNALHLMKSGTLTGFDRLRAAFDRGRGSAGLYRNAGLLVAELCAGIPPCPDPPTIDEVVAALRLRQLYGEHHRPSLAVEPALARSELEQSLAARFATIDDAALDHWFKHGCSPGTGELAKAAESLPARVARLLARARQRDRLVGAATLAPVLDAALTLPPRRRTPDPLPQGGYADVTTRGDPERLLPGQFALDPDEFVRRFAENELLYFEREEPHTATRPTRLIVLDQGVRTWGSVRLALSAAALALLGRDAKRVGRVRFAATSSPDFFDAADADLDALADVLEASDRTTTPAAALLRVLADDEDPDEPRDIVLLTHPRSAREAGVTSAAIMRRKTDRLFALCVDERGKAELAEWAGGGPVPVRTFRIDLELGESARVPREPVKASAQTWAGDAEPVPFPFRPGLVSEPAVLGFDADGEWLIVVGRDGTPHGVPLNGSPPEVLPRAFRDGVLLNRVEAVVGVTGGAVVCGRMLLDGSTFVAAHYDRNARAVALHVLGEWSEGARWEAHPDMHCVAVRTPGGAGCALDLETRGTFPTAQTTTSLVSRAWAAWQRDSKEVSPRSIPVTTGPAPEDISHLLVRGTRLELERTTPEWQAFTPERQGKPLLDGGTVEEAHLAGDVLAFVVHLSRGEQRQLAFYRGPVPVGLGELPHHRGEPFCMSRDGGRLARRRWHREVVVSETASPASPTVVVPQAGLHNGLGVRIDSHPFRLTLRVGGFEHNFRVRDNRLSHDLLRGITRTDRPTLEPPPPLPCDYDPGRFPPPARTCAGQLWAVLDRLGQVLVFGPLGLVASFLVRRERAAAWVPGGVYWGDTALIGGVATPNADVTIGAAIQSSS